MRALYGLALAAVGSFAVLAAQQPAAMNADDVFILTIYNQNFAVVRSTVDLNLKPGISEVTTTKVTRQMEPDSVVLRDPKGNRPIDVVEQNYDAAVIDQNRLLANFEGQTIDFQNARDHADSNGAMYFTVPGKIVRAPDNMGLTPIIEVDGKLQFQLPGTPLFPARADSLLLKPTLRWRIAAEHSENIHAELDYITNGLRWESTYNIVLPEDAKSDGSGTVPADVVGWVTIQNQSGTEFPAANIKLMAGDVAKLQPRNPAVAGMATHMLVLQERKIEVTQKAFDDFHLYDLHRTVYLRDGETKQVEFLRAARVPITRRYEYDGAGGGDSYGLNLDRSFESGDNKKVTIVQTFKNTEANHLGMPLPAGKLRFYRQDDGGQVEFTGESTIDHTPKDGTIRVVTGDAFDITGERRQTDFHVDTHAKNLDETFEIKVKNVKDTPATVSVIEHLNRWSNWKIVSKSADYKKTDSRTIEFPVLLAPNEEKTVTYTAHYSW
jgi:hypothetical protein